MMLIDLNKHLLEYIKVFGKKNVNDHINKLLNNYNDNKGDKKNATSQKKINNSSGSNL